MRDYSSVQSFIAKPNTNVYKPFGDLVCLWRFARDVILFKHTVSDASPNPKGYKPLKNLICLWGNQIYDSTNPTSNSYEKSEHHSNTYEIFLPWERSKRSQWSSNGKHDWGTQVYSQPDVPEETDIACLSIYLASAIEVGFSYIFQVFHRFLATSMCTPYIHMYTYTYIHTYIHTYMYTYIYIYKLIQSGSLNDCKFLLTHGSSLPYVVTYTHFGQGLVALHPSHEYLWFLTYVYVYR